jgi:hypothetical protein
LAIGKPSGSFLNSLEYRLDLVYGSRIPYNILCSDMPTIVFASPKGGAVKSTSAVLVTTQLAGHGAAVTLIDADPNKPQSRWAKLPGKPDNLTVIADVTENSIIDTIESNGRKTPFVIADLEGTASMMVAYAMQGRSGSHSCAGLISRRS